MAVSQKKMASNHKWDREHYDKVTGRLPIGTRERIENTGYSFNKFIVEAVLEKLERIEKD